MKISQIPFTWMRVQILQAGVMEAGMYTPTYSGTPQGGIVSPILANIVLHERRPLWQGNCEQCLACIHLCPQRAIEYGNETTGKERYQHPRVKLSELLAQTGRQAQRSGGGQQ